MSILNQAAVEALCSATYLENYLDAMDNLPDDLQRVVTQLRELDIQCRDLIQDLNYQHVVVKEDSNSAAKRKAYIAIQRALIKFQEMGDEKLRLLTIVTEHIENRARQLESDRENLDPTYGKDIEKEESVIVSKPKIEDKVEKPANKRQRRQKNHHEVVPQEEENKDDNNKVAKKKKKRKVKKERGNDRARSPIDPPIDPDEPTYCLCDQVSYGEMIGCDNDTCVIEWFHFNCVGLTHKPKGKWYCPKCRGESSKAMRKFDK